MENNLLKWQKRYEDSKSSYQSILDLMDEREEIYKGTRKIDKRDSGGTAQANKEANHIRNFTFELIEAQVDSSIPSPKVTTMQMNSEGLSREIEDSIRADLERLPIELLNDEQERTAPIQGGSFFLVEWDNSIRTHSTIGDLALSVIHTKNVIPQTGIYNINQMDYIFVRIPRTKEYIKRRYGVEVDTTEQEQGIDTTGESPKSDEKVTQVLAYYKNDKGGIGLYSWVDDVVLEDLEDYQARQLEKCTKCGKEKPFDKEKCECGSKSFKKSIQNTETLIEDVQIMMNGQPFVIPKGTEIPYYKPNKYPLVLRKNVSAFGQFLGDSDVDKIRDQQMLGNKLGSKLEEKLVTAGSAITLPMGLKIALDDSECKVIRLTDPNQINAIKAINLQPNIQYDYQVYAAVYDVAMKTLGINPTFLGQADQTAESGKAKQIQIDQALGRLESKRKMKAFAYSELFELMFKFKLAYTDEPRPFMTEGADGVKQYGEFSRYDFLEVDAAGEWYYNDNFLFSTDPGGALGQNRQAMWEETRRNFAEGVFGDPTNPQTLILFWSLMEALGYPKAGQIKAQMQVLAEQMQQAQQAMAQQAMAQQTMAQPPMEDVDTLLADLGV